MNDIKSILRKGHFCGGCVHQDVYAWSSECSVCKHMLVSTRDFDFPDKYELRQELTELERQAKIGRYTEMVFAKGGWIQIPCENDLNNEKDLQEWGENQEAGE